MKRYQEATIFFSASNPGAFVGKRDVKQGTSASPEPANCRLGSGFWSVEPPCLCSHLFNLVRWDWLLRGVTKLPCTAARERHTRGPPCAREL